MDGAGLKKRIRFWLWAIVFGMVVILAAAAGWRLAGRMPASESAVVTMPIPKDLSGEKRQVHLYFSDDQGRFLNAEPRMIRKTKDEVLYGRMLVQELIRGPQRGGGRTLPENATVRAFFLMNDGTAYVDFEEQAFKDHPGGLTAELLSIYSVVNTLLLNSDVISSVQFLIGGREAATLAGHIDLNRPFTANMLLVR